MLTVDDIEVFYGQSQALHGVTIEVMEGEAVTLLGRNGAGKTTTLRSIMGFNPPRSGTIAYRGTDITNESTYETVNRGLGYVPEDREVWGSLTVRENLEVPAGNGGDRTIDDIYDIFPKLETLDGSQAKNLSGGEQQMLAIGRGLLGGTELLLLDEASEGLAPQIVEDVKDALLRLKDELTILMVEQNVELALEVADRAYIYVNGKVVEEDTAENLSDNPNVLEEYLAVD